MSLSVCEMNPLGQMTHFCDSLALRQIMDPYELQRQESSLPGSCKRMAVLDLQGTTPSPYEAAAQLRKKRPNEEADGTQEWRWQVNKRPKVPHQT